MIHSFAPIVGESPKVLILGTMPSVKSLEQHQYYGHPRNQFWPIMFELFKSDLRHDYNQDVYMRKVGLAISKGVAIWDVLASCERIGSLDSDIKNEQPNDIVEFLDQHKSIVAIIFNGAKAETSFKKYFKELYKARVYKFIKMPSTSPAYTLSLDEKMKSWKLMLELIG